MSFGSCLRKGVGVPGLLGGRILASDDHGRLTEWDSLSLTSLAEIEAGRILGRSGGGSGSVEALAQIPDSALPLAAARLNQAGVFSELMTFAGGGVFTPLSSDPAAPGEGQVWWRSGALWMKDATGVVPFVQAGTWTPTLRPDVIGDFSVSYSQQTGIWVRTGRSVLIGLNLQTSSMTWTTASGAMRILGLPFASLAVGEASGTMAPRSISGLSLPSSSTTVLITPNPGSTSLLLMRQVLNAASSVSYLALNSTNGFVSGQNVTLAGWGLPMRIA